MHSMRHLHEASTDPDRITTAEGQGLDILSPE